MNILYLLIPLAMLFALVVGLLLLWAIRSGQYDDLEGPAHRILMDDDDPRIPTQPPASGSGGRGAAKERREDDGQAPTSRRPEEAGSDTRDG
ncbi:MULTISPECIES: cbb3-type cytochrome oxidase assembly protein CcoS [Thioalkalivibrio]|uniref:Cytochrome oxidase maturation protein, cbb3-type n=1 Tax=Thioalkalivibrio halophilus TaxID=252474 RepID=A0A1V3A1R3_9GAMM|nr:MULTISPECIES: cbb3-type cytochrome oxidase assembly protein CcoS [Thioalkalivibrio]OOC11282.1 cytochrome oxidase maturation protein, cbb3-type [Thioalkalivibrio halophilus]PYG01514.1 cbb3-type cytochrome oxidase maturation protein [Thioalkalivibrio sp. ALE21]